jgi:hypothetical protein
MGTGVLLHTQYTFSSSVKVASNQAKLANGSCLPCTKPALLPNRSISRAPFLSSIEVHTIEVHLVCNKKHSTASIILIVMLRSRGCLLRHFSMNRGSTLLPSHIPCRPSAPGCTSSPSASLWRAYCATACLPSSRLLSCSHLRSQN